MNFIFHKCLGRMKTDIAPWFLTQIVVQKSVLMATTPLYLRPARPTIGSLAVYFVSDTL